MTLAGRVSLAWKAFIVPVKVVSSLSILFNTQTDPPISPGRLGTGRSQVYPRHRSQKVGIPSPFQRRLDLTRNDCRTLEHLVGPAIH